MLHRHDGYGSSSGAINSVAIYPKVTGKFLYISLAVERKRAR